MTERGQQYLEIQLEEQHLPFWQAALANSVTGYFASAQYRFVARSADETVRVEGAWFPLLHFLDPDDQETNFVALSVARDRLDQLETQLVESGWTPTGTSGTHWWSRTYAREVSVPVQNPTNSSGGSIATMG
jgi:hypothetical protein